MGGPLHLHIGFDPAHHRDNSCGCTKSCLLVTGATHSDLGGGAKASMSATVSMQGGSYKGGKSCMLLLDRRWCESDGIRGGMGRLCLPLSLLEVSDCRSIRNRTRVDSRGGFIDEYAHSSGNTRSMISLCGCAYVSCPFCRW